MNRSTLLRTSLAAMAIMSMSVAVVAQGPPSPPPELAKFDRMLGTWEGSGTALMSPDAPPGPWTATFTMKKILNGHFIQDDTIVRLGGPSGPVLRFRGLYSWDREHKRFTFHGLGNEGKIHEREATWDGDSLILPGLDFEGDKPTVGREILTLTKEGVNIKIESCMGTGPFMTVVQGKFKRKQGPATDPTARADEPGERPASQLEKSGGALKPPAEELKKLKRFVGTWKVAGTVIPAPGAPPMKVTATETFRFTHDGQIMSVHVMGDPGPDGFTYEGYGYMAWNQRLKRFDMLHANNMGESGALQAHFINENELIAISSGLHMGQPSANRMHFKFNKDGTMSGASDQLVGAEKAKRNFEGTYTRVK